MSDEQERRLERAAKAGDPQAIEQLATLRSRAGAEQHGPWQTRQSGRTTMTLERARRLGGAMVLVPNFAVGRSVERLARDLGIEGVVVVDRVPRGIADLSFDRDIAALAFDVHGGSTTAPPFFGLMPVLADHTWWEQGCHEGDNWSAAGVLKATRYDTQAHL